MNIPGGSIILPEKFAITGEKGNQLVYNGNNWFKIKMDKTGF